MPEFKYYIKDSKTGRQVTGLVSAANEAGARATLRQQGLKPIRVHDATKPPYIMFSEDEKGNTQFNMPPMLQPGVGLADVVMFCKQFSVMIDAGLPILEGLVILSDQSSNPTFRYQIKMAAESVESGSTLSESLAKFPETFDRLFCNMIAAGEEGGILDSILRKLALFMDKNLKLIKTLKSAMIYPIGVILVSFVVIAILLVVVVPVFEKMFSEMGNELPALTQAIIDMSRFATSNIIEIIVAIVATLVAGTVFRKSENGARLIDRWVLKLPVVGEVIRAVGIARFCGTMSTMMAAGVPIVDSLDICSRTAGNQTIEDEIMRMRSAVLEGSTLTSVLGTSAIFPRLVVSMISVGEESGNLDSMLEKISIYYEEVVDDAVKVMTSMIEPIMIVGLGGIIGTLVIAMYLPIFSMASNIG